jgi:hypothetical protein
MKEQPSTGSTERVLREHLEGVLAERSGSGTVISGIERTPFRYVGSYACYIVTVRLDCGEELRLLLKDFGFSQKSKDNPKQRRERERGVYSRLLSQADLGTPGYYGSIWDEPGRRFWLLVELVDGVVVQHGDTDNELLAASWLGRMQGYFARDAELLRGCDFLIRHDANFFRTKAREALRDASRISAPAAHRLAAMVDRYETAIEFMASQPRTLVHGAYIPWHLLVDAECEPRRVCVIDWELAAVGATLYDLAIFSDDADSSARKRLWDAYLRSAEENGVPTPGRPELAHAVDSFRLHRIFDWLSRSVENRFSAKKVERLVDRAREHGARVLD